MNDETAKFYDYVCHLHAVKHESYGDSWKKRGEKMSILANIARKVDRLGVSDEFDSSADTLIDLWVYLAKYRCWLAALGAGPENVNPFLLWSLENAFDRQVPLSSIVQDFDEYVSVMDTYSPSQKRSFVSWLLYRVAPLARDQWYVENEYKGSDVD